MTRRQATLLALGIPTSALWAFASKEFWNQKPPEAWSAEEKEQLLTRSPWAVPASISYNGGPGNLQRGRWMGPTPTPGESGRPDYRATARWESALPIRLAAKTKLTGDDYVIALVGELPAMMKSSAGDEDDKTAHDRQLEMLKQYTKLEKHGDFLPLSNIEPMDKGGMLFYFSRLDPIKQSDNVTFVTKIGPIEVKAKFAVKEMTCRGKLEL